MRKNFILKKVIPAFACCFVVLLIGNYVSADTITQRYHCCTPCYEVVAETQQTGDPVTEAAGFVTDAMAKCRAKDPNCSPAAESGPCTTGLEQTANTIKCADKYPKGQGEGQCLAPSDCNAKKWGAPVQVVGGQELCDVNGERCCVWSGEAASSSAAKPSGQTAEQLQSAAKAAFDKFGVSGNVTGAATVIGRAVRLLMAFMGSIALVLYIYAGIIWMTASGAKEKISQAQQILVWTTFGAVVMLGSYILANFIFSNVIK